MRTTNQIKYLLCMISSHSPHIPKEEHNIGLVEWEFCPSDILIFKYRFFWSHTTLFKKCIPQNTPLPFYLAHLKLERACYSL